MIFEKPTLFKTGTFKSFLNFAKKYNAGKPKGQQLRKQHKSLFNDILFLYDKFLKERMQFAPGIYQNIQPKNIPALTTNNVRLCTAFTYEFKEIAYDENGKPLNESSEDTCTRSIQNYISRLVKAGVIEKVNHGLGCKGGKIRASKAEQDKKDYSRFTYDIKINPEILVLFDAADLSKIQNSKFLNYSESELLEALQKTFPEFGVFTRTPINKINSNDTNESGVSYASKQKPKVQPGNDTANSQIKASETVDTSAIADGFITRTPETTTYDETANEELRYKHVERIFNTENNVQTLLRAYRSLGEGGRRRLRTTVSPVFGLKIRKLTTCLAFWDAFEPIMQGKEIPEPVYYQTIEYVYHVYFKGAETQNALDKRLQQYQEMFAMIRKWINRENFSMRNVYPMQYLDVNRKGINPETKKHYISFVNTFKWYENFKKYQHFGNMRKIASELMKRLYKLAHDTNRKMSQNPKEAANVMQNAVRVVTSWVHTDEDKATLLQVFEPLVAGAYKVKPTKKAA